MPNSNPSQHTPAKTAALGAEGGSAKATENQPQSTHAAGVIADKAREVGGEARASFGEPRHTLAEKVSPEQLQHATRSALSNAKERLADAKEESASRLHHAHDTAAESYRAVRERALDMAHQVDERARELSHAVADETRHAWGATGRFVSTHALPLTVLGVGLGWLAWSLQRESRRSLDLPPTAPRRQRDVGATRSASRGDERGPRAAGLESPDSVRAAMTTSGAKLMGVRPGQPEI